MNRTTTITSTITAAALTLLLSACGSDEGANPFAGVGNDTGGDGSQTDNQGQPAGDYCDAVVQLVDTAEDKVSGAYASGSSHAEVTREIADAFREIAAGAPDAGIADDWSTAADAWDALADLPAPDDDPSGEQREQLYQDWDFDAIRERLDARMAECGVDLTEAGGGSQAADGGGQHDQDAEQESEAVASAEYCSRVEPFADDLFAASTFSDYERGSAVEGQLEEIAALAPSQAVADDWSTYAMAVGLLSLEDMSDPTVLSQALYELSTSNPSMFGDLPNITMRLGSHLRTVCQDG
ncbi:hypothetical protein [Phytoactinopolyspora halotolerans]|uniref:Lipoprotein n=1 Tax=Phytoactinopolyspora halotolerans TaxID=1981512 RepID=A0A6L9S8Q4_9ACTN|nr:hypothetical protein [Phytoactinopolyspora halotolerans]NEE01606.1 hypothetical protein [Phytoactinopolyspora halotolerans]